MEYDLFVEVLNNKIFEETKSKLFEKFAKYPERYIGVFRGSKSKGKIIQNLTQSQEIKFGDAFEVILKKYFQDFEYTTLPTILRTEGRKKYHLDQLFRGADGEIIFIEQKVRDDHDSTKKNGQIQNFKRKIEILKEEYPEARLICFFYFLDPSLEKNKSYYQRKITNISEEEDVECYLQYGKEIFTHLGQEESWEEIVSHLTSWRETVPELPEIDFDINEDIEENFEEIRRLSPNVFLKIFTNDEIYEKMILTVSPRKELLKKLLDYFAERVESTDIGTRERNSYKKVYDVLYPRLRN